MSVIASRAYLLNTLPSLITSHYMLALKGLSLNIYNRRLHNCDNGSYLTIIIEKCWLHLSFIYSDFIYFNFFCFNSDAKHLLLYSRSAQHKFASCVLRNCDLN